MKNDNARKIHLRILLGVVASFALSAGLTVHAKNGDKPDPPAKKIDWKKNWERQKFLFRWPSNSKLLSQFDQMNFKFGEPLPTDQGELDEFMKREVYLYEFSSLLKKDAVGPGTGMADKVAPTQFKGGWQRVLRHVNDWGPRRITKDQVWLVMEDIWVQQSMLDAVRSVNEELASFRRARKAADGNFVVDPSFNQRGKKVDLTGKPIATPDAEKLDTLFRNRTWAVELKVVKHEGTNSNKLTGKLINLSDRLQLMGTNNTMVLKVWFANVTQPFLFKIGGEFLAGKGATKVIGVEGRGVEVPANELPITFMPSHLLPAGMELSEIVGVEQVLDVRTVPIKRIDKLVLGNKVSLDSRNADRALKSPSFIKEEEAPPPGAPPAPGGPPGGIGGGDPQASDGVMGGGSVTAVIDANKKRYLEVTPQVRRLPVGIVVLVDQSYLQDVLLAFANSPLQFQITQVEIQRFHGTLAGASNSNQPGDDIVRGFGRNNIQGPGDPDAPRPPVLPPRIGPPGPIGPGPLGPPGPNPQPGKPNASTISDAQVTSGLVELSVYGVVSLYEKPGDLVVKPIVADREDRFNWPRWSEVFLASLPRPGTDGNLTETSFRFNSTMPAPGQPAFNQVKLWRGEGRSGLEALEWYKARLQKGVSIEDAIADERSIHPKALAMVNIETVHARWVNDVNTFLQVADMQVQEKFANAIADWMLDAEREKDERIPDKPRWKPKGPTGGGWVIELRGWTDHDKGPAFINQSLLRNLQRTDDFAQQTDKDGGKVGKYIVGVPDPVKGKVSHAFVYRVFPPIHDPTPGEFYNIKRGSFLDGLVEPALMPPGKPKGAALAPAWTPLNGGKAAGALQVMPPRKEDSTRRRYEFVVMVVWREPTSTPAAAPPGP